MPKTSLVSVALAMGILCGHAIAQTPAPNIFPNYTAREADPGTWTGAFSVGYSTNYDVRGLIPSSTVCENLTSFVLSGCYKFDEKTYFTARADYEVLWDKGVLDRNQLDLRFLVDHRLSPHFSVRAGYDLFKGGILGYVAQTVEHSKHDMTQEGFVGLRYDFAGLGIDNLFFATQTHYSFAGLWGWWWDASLGYSWEVSSRFNVQLTGTWYASSSYWDSKIPFMAGGSQSFVVQVDLPYKVSDHFSISPFVSLSWLGNGALKNRHLRDIPFISQDSMFKSFDVVGGVRFVYHF